MMGDGTVIFSNSPANETAAFNFQKAKCRENEFNHLLTADKSKSVVEPV
jgi:hypothetical protein